LLRIAGCPAELRGFADDFLVLVFVLPGSGADASSPSAVPQSNFADFTPLPCLTPLALLPTARFTRPSLFGPTGALAKFDSRTAFREAVFGIGGVASAGEASSLVGRVSLCGVGRHLF
jgi:hypothetical protein